MGVRIYPKGIGIPCCSSPSYGFPCQRLGWDSVHPCNDLYGSNHLFLKKFLPKLSGIQPLFI